MLCDADPFICASLKEAGQRLQAGVAENALVWRQGLRPRITACDGAAAVFAQALLSGATLAHALDQAPGQFAFDYWLPQVLQDGLVLGVVRCG